MTRRDDENSPVTVIGLGPMGFALAAAFLGSGRPTTVWNRSAAKADSLVARGAVRADTPAEAVSAGGPVIVCLSDYDAVHKVLDGVGDALRGRVLVNLTSGTPLQAGAASAWAQGHGAQYLDGAIMVPVPAVGAPGAVILYSGPQEVFDAWRPTLAIMGGDPKYLGTDPGLAVLYNTALLGMMYATINGFLHANALVASAGVPAAQFTPLAVDWFLPSVVGTILTSQIGPLDSGEHPGTIDTLEMSRTAIGHILDTSRERDVALDVPVALKALADRGVAEGRGEGSYFGLAEVLKQPSGG